MHTLQLSSSGSRSIPSRNEYIFSLQDTYRNIIAALLIMTGNNPNSTKNKKDKYAYLHNRHQNNEKKSLVHLIHDESYIMNKKSQTQKRRQNIIPFHKFQKQAKSHYRFRGQNSGYQFGGQETFGEFVWSVSCSGYTGIFTL